MSKQENKFVGVYYKPNRAREGKAAYEVRSIQKGRPVSVYCATEEQAEKAKQTALDAIAGRQVVALVPSVKDEDFDPTSARSWLIMLGNHAKQVRSNPEDPHIASAGRVIAALANSARPFIDLSDLEDDVKTLRETIDDIQYGATG